MFQSSIISKNVIAITDSKNTKYTALILRSSIISSYHVITEMYGEDVVDYDIMTTQQIGIEFGPDVVAKLPYLHIATKLLQSKH